MANKNINFGYDQDSQEFRGSGRGKQSRGRGSYIVQNNFRSSRAHSSMTTCSEKNDPLWRETLLPCLGLHPIPGLSEIRSGVEGLDVLVNEYHVIFSAHIGGSYYSRSMTQSALGYYFATMAFARMLDLHQKNGYPLSFEESRFLDVIKGTNYLIPEGLQLLLAGLGNTRFPGGELKFRLPSLPYTMGSNHLPGFFGRVDEHTHYLYKSIPCLAVYAQRILESIGGGHDAWDLPDNIRPDLGSAQTPSKNMLGYGLASPLIGSQKEFFANAGIINRMDCNNPVIPLHLGLLNAVWYQIELSRNVKLLELPISRDGSQAQVAYLITPTVNSGRVEVHEEMRMQSCVRISKPVSDFASLFCYRILHKWSDIEDAPGSVHANWSVYNFINDEVPLSWAQTINTQRDKEPDILQIRRFQSDTYQLCCIMPHLTRSL